jgi:alcohol dehydrogenase class IV
VAARLTDLAAATGVAKPSPEGFLRWLDELKAAIGIPRNLADGEAALGVTREHIDRLVNIAVNDVCHQNNPKPVSAADFRALFDRALPGA